MTRLVADIDDIVTCTKGHPMYRVLTPLFIEGKVEAADFEPLHPRLNTPAAHTRIDTCPRCRSRCATQGLGGIRVHFEEGWRP